LLLLVFCVLEVFVSGLFPLAVLGLFELALAALFVWALGGRSVFTAAFAPAGRAATTPGP
jgi:hypothetical protein